jgi:phospholipid/cholesterol/gamma-HCH transport system substrate-binding protein
MAGGCTGSSKERTLIAEFADVGDLVNRANVQKSDTVVGRISKIELHDWHARVTMVLQPGLFVPQGTHAVVRSTSLLGEKFVDLQPPPEANDKTPPLADGAVLPADINGKTPEVEEVFNQLGAILASGALEDLGTILTAGAKIVQGQEDRLGSALDGTSRLVEVLAAQRQPLADALDHLASTAKTLAGGKDTINGFLDTTEKVGNILASQTAQLDNLVVQLDRLGSPSADLMRAYKADIDSQLKSLIKIVPQLTVAKGDLDKALTKLPIFARLFADAIPGDYVQLDAHLVL